MGSGHRAPRGETSVRRFLPTIAIGVAVALVSAVLTVVAHRQLADDSGSSVPVADAGATLELPRSGLVVTLSRPGFVTTPVTDGSDNAFVVSVVAERSVAAVELLAGASVVDRIVPDDRVASRTDRLVWHPDGAGTTTVVARAYGADGRVGQSNPLRVDVRPALPTAGIASVVSAPGETLGDLADRYGTDRSTVAAWNQSADRDPGAALPTGTEVEVPIGLGAIEPTTTTSNAQGIRGPTTSRALPPLPSDITTAAAPHLEVATRGCGVTVDARPGADGQQLYLLQVPPTGGAYEPVAAITDPSVALGAGLGPHDFVLAAGDAGALVAWSDPVSVTVDDPACSGWQGTARLQDGSLVLDGGPEAESAYLYLSTSPGEWVRVPAKGSVPRGIDGGYGVAGSLPPLPGSTLRIEAWGRVNGQLTALGTGTYTPPPPPSGPNDHLLPSTAVGIGNDVSLPKAQLWWLRPADWKHGGDPPEAVTSGAVPGTPTLHFQWTAPTPAVTHGLVQVTSAAVPPTAGPDPGGVLVQKTVTGNGGTFDLDFATVLDAFLAQQNGGIAQVSPPGSQTYQAIAGLGALGGGSTPSITASPHPLDLDPTDDFDVEEVFHQLFVVRVVPMAGDSWGGLVSNDVDLDVTPSGARVAPAGARPYALDVQLVKPPRPPDPSKMNCWEFAGWTDPAALQEHLDAEAKAAAASATGVNLGTYTVWKALVTAVGDGPICAGCYHIGSLTVGVAGADCSDSGFFDDLFDAFKTFVNMLSSAFAFIKDQIIDLVVSATGCKAAGDTAASICSTLAEAVLDAALASLGIPPSLPNWDELIAAAKGDIVALGVGLATQLGVPCDDASFAAEVDGQPGLTCEAALEALLDEAQAQIDQLYSDTATAMGFHFPDLMKVRPHPSGQVGPAEVKVTVHPTQYSKAEKGKTCPALILSNSIWAGKIDLATTAKVGKYVTGPLVSGVVPSVFGGVYQIPHQFWAGSPFEANFVQLPDLQFDSTDPTGYRATSRTYQVYPPTQFDPVQVNQLYIYAQQGVTGSNGEPVPGVTYFGYQWPEQVFLLNAGAQFTLTVVSGCATGTGSHTWILPGFAPAPAVKVK